MKPFCILIVLVLIAVAVVHVQPQQTKKSASLHKLKERRKAFTPGVLADRPNSHPTSLEHGPTETFQPVSECPPSSLHHRTADGSCNNLGNPSWGQAGSPYIRLLRPEYDDDCFVPRQTGEGRQLLPSPRLISTGVLDTVSRPSRYLTMMAMQWGQFLDHDLGATPTNSVNATECCNSLKSGNDYFKGGDCYPIFVPNNDKVFNISCMSFSRSSGLGGEIEGDPREQFNSITSFIDASMVYGSSEDESLALRAGEHGLMDTVETPVSTSPLLPRADDGECIFEDKTDFCFLAGDARVNVFPGLAAMHTIFVRFHNRVANDLKILSNLRQLLRKSTRKLSDEELYQTSRKVVSAVIQRITYKEYLPSVFGNKFMETFRLDRPYKYDHRINPTLINSFTTAAFRYGHSLIPDSMKIDGKKIPMHELFLHTRPVIRHFKDVVQNLHLTFSENGDSSVTTEMMNKLFNHSLDIVALNIQRGRDHGLPSFAEFRRECGLDRVKSFKDFGPCADSLASIYKSPEDVDLFIGGLCENIKGSEVGPTFECIIGTQFYNLKFGDRYYYDENPKFGFSGDQLRLINDVTLSKLLCEFGEIDKVQSNVFMIPDEHNRMESCEKSPLKLVRSLYNFL